MGVWVLLLWLSYKVKQAASTSTATWLWLVIMGGEQNKTDSIL